MMMMRVKVKLTYFETHDRLIRCLEVLKIAVKDLRVHSEYV